MQENTLSSCWHHRYMIYFGNAWNCSECAHLLRMDGDCSSTTLIYIGVCAFLDVLHYIARANNRGQVRSDVVC